MISISSKKFSKLLHELKLRFFLIMMIYVIIYQKNLVRSLYKLIWACENFFSQKIVIFSKFSIFDSKFLENYITDFPTETIFELSRARALKCYLFLVPTIKYNFHLSDWSKFFWYLKRFETFVYSDFFWKNPITIKRANLDQPNINYSQLSYCDQSCFLILYIWKITKK